MCSRMRAIDLRRVWALHDVTWRYLASIAASIKIVRETWSILI